MEATGAALKNPFESAIEGTPAPTSQITIDPSATGERIDNAAPASHFPRVHSSNFGWMVRATGVIHNRPTSVNALQCPPQVRA